MLTIYIQTLIDGILIGGVYAVIGLGLSLAYGVMGIVNWCHGANLMMSLYLAYYLTKSGMDPYLTIPICVLCMAAVGFIMQKFIFNKMLKAGPGGAINILLLTCGIDMASSAAANMIFSGETFFAKTAYSGKTIQLAGLYISVPKLISFVIATAVAVLLYLVIQRTEMGRAIRATSQDRTTAQIMGINAELVFCVAFAISLGLVGLSGSLLTPFYSVYPYVGAAFSFKAFVIVVVGGKGNIAGAVIGGIAIGIIERMGSLLWSESVAQIFTFLMFIIILLVKPDGLLSRKKS